jgi:hypothetical protein
MGIKTNLVGITFTTQDKVTAVALGLDLVGFVADMELACQELTDKLNFLINDVLTPAGDISNTTTINTQITALS